MLFSEPVYDVAVIGAGPAGAMAVASLSDLGANVICLHNPNTGLKANGTLETVTPETLFILSSCQPDLRSQISPLRIHTTISTWGSSIAATRAGIQNPHGGSHVLDRDLYHRLLLDCLSRRRVDLYEGYVDLVRKIPDGWEIFANGNGKKRIKAKYLIDASGRNSKIPKQLGLNRERFDKLVVRNFILPAGKEDLCLRMDSLPHGWIFSLRGEQHRSISIFTDSNLLNSRRDPQGKSLLLSSLDVSVAVAEVVSTYDLEQVTHTYILPATSSTLRRAASPSFFICGDAASTCDPISSGGIAEAISSSMDAVETILNSESGDENAWRRFEQNRQSRYKAYLIKRKAVYASETRWENAPFWVARQSTNGNFQPHSSPRSTLRRQRKSN